MKNKKEIRYYTVKSNKLKGTDWRELKRAAINYQNSIVKNPRRKPFVKSRFYSRKVFLDSFWERVSHLRDADKQRRVKFFFAAIELIRHSTIPPLETYEAGNKLLAFYGQTRSDEKFCVHLRRGNNGSIYFMSCFPAR